MLGALTRSVVTIAQNHRDIAYGLIALVSFSESIPVAGAFVPGDALILGVSALVPTGAVKIWPLILAAMAGAVLGDGFAFWLGRHYHETILNRWPFRGRPKLVQRGTAFLQRHGGKSVFVARFTPGVRAIVPVLGGVLRMDVGRFYFMNVLSAILWSPAHILAGALIGASFALLGAVAGRLALIVAIVLVLLGLAYVLVRYALQRVLPLALRAQEHARLWARGHDSWLARQVLSVLDPARKEMPGLALLTGIVLCSLWLFFGVLQDVIAGDPLVRANSAVFHFLQGLRTEWVDQVMVAITELGDVRVVAAVTVVSLAWFGWRRNWRAAAHLIAVLAVAALVTIALKVTLQVHRPEPIDTGWDAFAFPSGHSVSNAALYGFLGIITLRDISARWRVPLAGGLVLLVGAIAFSRVYLGAHWLSDVLAGVAFGTATAALFAMAYLRHNPPPVGATGLSITACLGLLLMGAAHIDHRHAHDMRRYAVHHREYQIAFDAWWQHEWARLPARRVDLIGGAEEPLAFQWAGRRNALRTELAEHGWRAPPRWTARTATRWLEPHVSLTHLPVLPHLENGHREVLVLVHPVKMHPSRQRLVLRLWRSDFKLTRRTARSVPVYIGSVVDQHAKRVTYLMTLTYISNNYNAPRDELAASLMCHRLAKRTGTSLGRRWDGRVLLAQPAGTDRLRTQRRTATTAHMASTRPNGHAPCKNP